jgi:hypothetical protein
MNKWFVSCLLGGLVAAVPMFGDTVVSTGGTGSFISTAYTVDNSGSPFWDNLSADGEFCNIGFWLTGTATGCKNSSSGETSGLPIGEAPGALEYWGNSADVNDPNYYFTADGSAKDATLRLELAGLRDYNAFGWFDTADPLTLHELFSGPTSAVSTAVFTPSTNFGFYFTDSKSNTFYTTGSSEQRFALFRETPKGGGDEVLAYWIGVEDSTGDMDFQDMVVRVSAVPEPSGYLGLALMLGGLGFMIYRRRATAV